MSETKSETQTNASTWLTPDQVDAIRDAAMTVGPTYLQDRDETIITTLADTGLRVSELVDLEWQDVHLDLETPYIYLPAEKQKSAPGDASLDLGDGAARQLRRFEKSRYKDTNHVFFSRQSDQIGERQVRNVVTNAAVAADVEPHVVGGGRGDPEDVSPHTFRHSIAYRMIRIEEQRLEDVQLRLRHATRQTTENVYGHIRRR